MTHPKPFPCLQDPQWVSEVTHFCPDTPIVLVGCKSDLRNDPKTLEELHKTSQTPVPQQIVRQTLTPRISYTCSSSPFPARPTIKEKNTFNPGTVHAEILGCSG